MEDDTVRLFPRCPWAVPCYNPGPRVTSGAAGLEENMVVLTDEGSRAEIVPERGALVSRFIVEGEPILFLDESTLADPTKNVRGGIPVLFPAPGVLSGATYTATT